MKNRWFVGLLGISVLMMAYQAYAAENIAVSTYYPSPYGSYTQLDSVTLNVTGNTTLNALTAGAVNGASFTSQSFVTATGAVTGGSVISQGVVTAAGAVSGASVSATGEVRGNTVVSTSSITAGGMTMQGTGGNGNLRVQQVGGDYYCYAVYA